MLKMKQSNLKGEILRKNISIAYFLDYFIYYHTKLKNINVNWLRH